MNRSLTDLTVIYCTVQSGTVVTLVGDLVSHRSTRRLLLAGAGSSQLAIVKYLVEQEAGKDQASSNGSTYLCSSSLLVHLTVVKYLVEQGADNDNSSCHCSCV